MDPSGESPLGIHKGISQRDTQLVAAEEAAAETENLFFCFGVSMVRKLVLKLCWMDPD